jgi:pimeloyl-ACP methyl ester carboxylesterase
MTESIITFDDENGRKIYGVLHTPKNIRFKVAINILNPGLMNRVAPHGMNIKLARLLCDLGFVVWRIDPPGIGDSEGVIEEKKVLDIWGDIQRGLFVNSNLLSNQVIKDLTGISEYIYIGSCGGAITALLASLISKEIVGIICIDLPVLIDSSENPINFADKIEGKEMAETLFADYSKKLLKLSSLFRFLTFRSDYAALGKILRLKLNLEKSKDIDHELLPDTFNMKIIHFIDQNRMPALFLIASNYVGTTHFNKYLRPLLSENNLCLIHTIADSNHIYSLPGNEAELHSEITRWFQLKFDSYTVQNNFSGGTFTH